MHISDDELREYLEGRAEAEVALRIETAMQSDVALERRLMALDDVGAGVRRDMRATPDDARIARIAQASGLSPGAAKAKERRALPRLALVASLLLGLGLGWSGALFSAPAGDWRVEVAHYQALYTEHTLAGARFDAPEIAAQLARASEKVGAVLPAEALSELAGMELLRAQVLGFDNHPLAQIVYRGESGAPVALCLLRTGAANADIEVSELRGMAAASWSSGGVEYLLIGGDDQGWITNRAEQIRSTLRSAT